MKHIELHSNHIMSIHFPFSLAGFLSDLNLTTVMNSALAIKTKDYYAEQCWLLVAAWLVFPPYSKQPTDVLH